MQPTRTEAWDLVCQWVQSESLRKHLLCVEAAMRVYAQKYGGDPDLWGLAGLLHDLDYEKYPQPDPAAKTGHPFEAVKYFQEQNYPPEIIDAILGHALYSGVPRTSDMAKALFACDELCGFIVACAHVRPEKLNGLTAASVLKKLKVKTFAEKVSREDIDLGIAELAIDKNEHIDFVIAALQGIADKIFAPNNSVVGHAS